MLFRSGEQVVELAIAVPVHKGLDLGGRLQPTLLERRFTDVLGHRHVGGVELAVADDADMLDGRYLFADELEDRTAEVSGDAAVGLGARELFGQERVIEALAAGGEAGNGVRTHRGVIPGWLWS